MDYVSAFFIRNFILVIIAVVMLIHGVQRYREHPSVSIWIISIMAALLSIAVLEVLEDYGRASGNVIGCTVTSSLMYVLRPACILLFIFLGGQEIKNKWQLFLFLPILVNTLVFILPFIPATRETVFFFALRDDGTAYWQSGNTYLRFVSHLTAALYMGYLIYHSITRARSKHYGQATTLLICATFVIAATVVETFFSDGDIHLLNSTVAVSALIYYLYLFMELTRYSGLTRLFSRKTYYADLPRMEKKITGMVQLDMNGLKHINDTMGHKAGDKALRTIAAIILAASTRHMYAYRVGGDEFIVLVLHDDEEQIVQFVRRFRDTLAKTPYHCSVGYAYREDKSTPVSELYKQSEKMMYADKEAFYKNAPFERRKADIA